MTSNGIYEYVNESTIYYIIVSALFLLFLYIIYTTYSVQMNVIEGLAANKEKEYKKEMNDEVEDEDEYENEDDE